MNSIKNLVEGIPISKDYLSVRSYNCLRRTGYFYLSEVIDLDRDELIKIKQMGKQSVEEIIDLHRKLETLNRNEAIRFCCGVGEVQTNNEVLLKKTNIVSIAKDALVEANNFMCIDNDGALVEDCDIPLSYFSARTYNAIRRSNIDTIKELALFSNDVFLGLKGIGKASYDEVISFIQERTVIVNSGSASNITEEINEAVSKICAFIEPCVSGEINITFKKRLAMQISDMRDPDGNVPPVDESMLRIIIRMEPIKQLLENRILQIAGNSILDYFTVDDCKKVLTRIDAIDNSAVEWLINDLKESNQIIIRNNYLFDKTLSFETWMSSLNEKYRRIFIEKCKGKTLEEIGSQVGITRERVRQLIKKILSERPKLLEDGCSDVFSRYCFRDEEFQILFDVEPIIIGYLNLAYKKGTGDINDFYEDRTVPALCRQRANEAFGKRYLVTEKGEIIKINREELMKWFLKKYYSDIDVVMEDFYSAYSEWLCSYGLGENKNLLYASERSLEANISRLDFCLLKQGKKIRYYDIKSVDVEKLLNDIGITQYKGYEISTNKLIIDNPGLMQQLDIRDEYELHNILRKNPNTIGKYKIEIGRMPIISVGKSDRNKQVGDLLYQLAPIGYYDLALEYEIRYGVRKETVQANFLSDIMTYFDGDKFRVDQPSLSLDEYNKLKKALTDDFYLLNDLTDIFTNVIGPDKDELLNPMNIKELGFRLFSQFIIKDSYLTADSYFEHLLLSEPVFNMNEFKVGVRSIQAFGNKYRELRDTLSLVEISKDRFATLDYVCSTFENCNKETLMVIGRRLCEFSSDNLFSIAKGDISPEINPFINIVDNVYFYNSLIRIQRGIRSAVIGDVCLVSRGDKEPSTKTVLVELLKENGHLSFDELVEFALDKYRVVTNKSRVAYLLENTDGIGIDLVMETAFIDNAESNDKIFWKNSVYRDTITAKYNALMTSTDRIETVYKLECFKPFINYCIMNEKVYMKDLLELDLESILDSIGLSKQVITEVIDLFFHWVEEISNQTSETNEILDLFFK